MAPLSWRHHTLIQSLLSRGPLKDDEFRSIFSQIAGKNAGSRRQQEEKLFNEFLGKINSELTYVQLELRACRNQYDGHVYYGVLNNVADDQSKLGTKYTVPQIAFYKGIVEAIIQDAEAEGSIFNMDALNIKLEMQMILVMRVKNPSAILFTAPSSVETANTQFGAKVLGATNSQGGAVQTPPAFKNFSMSQKEKTLNQLVEDRWLCSTLEGKIGLGVRSFLDLRSLFRSNEVPACEVCNEAAIKAQLCPNEACNVRLHSYCLKNKVERVCSGCGTRLPGSSVKAEEAEEMNNSNGPSQSSQPSSKRSHRSYREANADSETDMLDRKRVTRTSARLRAK